jgi:hypothetical protein
MVRFVLADDLGEMFAGELSPEQTEKVVRGYRVRSSINSLRDGSKNALEAHINFILGR